MLLSLKVNVDSEQDPEEVKKFIEDHFEGTEQDYELEIQTNNWCCCSGSARLKVSDSGDLFTIEQVELPELDSFGIRLTKK